MLEEKLKLLSILSSHTADQNLEKHQHPSAEACDKLHINEYSEMFHLLANDCMNILYPSDNDEETTSDLLTDLESACEDAGISFHEVKRHGETYLNILKDGGKMENDDHKILLALLKKFPNEDEIG